MSKYLLIINVFNHLTELDDVDVVGKISIATTFNVFSRVIFAGAFDVQPTGDSSIEWTSIDEKVWLKNLSSITFVNET